VVSSAIVELYLEDFEEFLPEFGCENAIPVTYYGRRRAM
jgi:hypothetical protein